MCRMNCFWSPTQSSVFRRLAQPVLRTVCFVVLIALAGSSAKAQSIGYALNSSDGTVTIFATSPNPLGGGIVDAVLKTVPVCATPSNAALTPDSNHVYVTCSSDNSLWTIDVTDIAQGVVTPQNIPGLNLSAPGGVAISTLKTGSSAGKTLAYIVNSQTNTVSVIDTSTNALYDGPIALGTAPGASTGSVFAGLVAIAPDTTKVFVTINNPAPQLWMIDTTVKPEASTQVQVQNQGFPTAATDSIYLSVQESSSASDYYVLLASSVSVSLQPNPSLYLVDIVPAVAAGASGSTSNALFTIAQLGTSQPTHLVSLMTGGGLFGESPPAPPFLTAYTVDSTSLWVVNFTCSSADGSFPGSCVVTSATPTPVTGSGLLPIAPNGLGLTGVPFSDAVGFDARENIYITDGQPTGVIQVPIDVSNATAEIPLASAVHVGTGTQPPVFSPVGVASAPIVFFTGELPPPAVPVGATVAATGVSLVNPQNGVTAQLSFGVGNALLCNQSAQPCSSGPQTAVAGVGGSTDFPTSGVFTVTLQGIGTSSTGQPLPSGQATQTIVVGAFCVLSAAGVTPTNNLAVGQKVTVSLACIAPPNDSITGVLNWGDGLTSGPASAPLPAGDDGTVTLIFTHMYAAPNSYNITVLSITDTSGESPSTGNATGGSSPVTVNPLAVSVSPSPISVQITHSVSFAAAVQFDSTDSGVTWALKGTDCEGATCGVLSNITTTSVTYTAPSAVPASGMVSLTATSNATITYTDPATLFVVPIKLTTLPPPSCTLTAPSAGQTALSIMATVTCTAPAGDSLTATVNWGDGTLVSTSSATASGNGSASFTAFTHAYMSASNPKYSISLSVSDTTSGLTGSVTPPSVVIAVFQTPAVGPPSSMSSVTIVQGQSVTVPVIFSGGAAEAGITFSIITPCLVTPAGPACTVSPTTLTLDANGNGTVQVTVATVGPATALVVPQSEQQQGSLSASLMALPELSLVVLGLGLLATGSRRSPTILCLLLFFSLSIFGAGCGSSTQRSNLPCSNCTTAGSYKVTVMGTSLKPVLQASGTFTVVVQ